MRETYVEKTIIILRERFEGAIDMGKNAQKLRFLVTWRIFLQSSAIHL